MEKEKNIKDNYGDEVSRKNNTRETKEEMGGADNGTCELIEKDEQQELTDHGVIALVNRDDNEDYENSDTGNVAGHPVKAIVGNNCKEDLGIVQTVLEKSSAVVCDYKWRLANVAKLPWHFWVVNCPPDSQEYRLNRRENRSCRRRTIYATYSMIVGIADRSCGPSSSRTGLQLVVIWQSTNRRNIKDWVQGRLLGWENRAHARGVGLREAPNKLPTLPKIRGRRLPNNASELQKRSLADVTSSASLLPESADVVIIASEDLLELEGQCFSGFAYGELIFPEHLISEVPPAHRNLFRLIRIWRA
uniref:Uncharacterized protein n=1 Tax=Timema monikensis TaxID=170555 RepID=A0A7R9E6J0_9NEOP|nr:unnamed protein product [Timema monikensis]